MDITSDILTNIGISICFKNPILARLPNMDFSETTPDNSWISSAKVLFGNSEISVKLQHKHELCRQLCITFHSLQEIAISQLSDSLRLF